MLVDEWQLAGTDLLWTIKGMVDVAPAAGRFLLTGSVEPATYGPTYPLTGRATHLVMRPMTWPELEGRADSRTGLTALVKGDLSMASATAPLFSLDWLSRAGFPLARMLPDSGQYLDAYASLVSQRAGEEGRDSSRLLRTMKVIATLTGQATPDQRVWEAADINKDTWKHYEDVLLRSHLYAPAVAMESNRLKRLTSYPKRFLADTALALTLSGLSVADLRADAAAAGSYLESFVVQQLRPIVDLLGGALLHLRTGAGEHEVDIVIEVPGGVVGFEVKHGVRPRGNDARHLTWLRDQLGERFRHGYVVHTGSEAYPLEERIWAVPIGGLLGGVDIPNAHPHLPESPPAR